MDPRWLQEWAGELSAGVPGFQLLDEPVQVDSQETQQVLQQMNLEAEHDFDQLLRDEEACLERAAGTRGSRRTTTARRL